MEGEMNSFAEYILSEEDFDKKIEIAYNFAKEKHEGQYRETKEEYIIHPLNVVKILTTGSVL